MTKCPACKGRHLVPDGIEMVDHSPITVTSSSKTTQRFQVWIKFVAKFHCRTCLFPFEETVNKVTMLTDPQPAGPGDDAKARGLAIGAIKYGWNVRFGGLRLSQEDQEFFALQGWNACHETLKTEPHRLRISTEQIALIMSDIAGHQHLIALSSRP